MTSMAYPHLTAAQSMGPAPCREADCARKREAHGREARRPAGASQRDILGDGAGSPGRSRRARTPPAARPAPTSPCPRSAHTPQRTSGQIARRDEQQAGDIAHAASRQGTARSTLWCLRPAIQGRQRGAVRSPGGDFRVSPIGHPQKVDAGAGPEQPQSPERGSFEIFAPKWALKARSSTKIGALGGNVCGEADVEGPDWPWVPQHRFPRNMSRARHQFSPQIRAGSADTGANLRDPVASVPATSRRTFDRPP